MESILPPVLKRCKAIWGESKGITNKDPIVADKALLDQITIKVDFSRVIPERKIPENISL